MSGKSSDPARARRPTSLSSSPLLQPQNGMAKTSAKTKDVRRRRLVEQHGAKRQKLLDIMKNYDLPFEEREEAQRKLLKLPRDSSATRVRNRCLITGRSRAYLRKFGVCRVKFRELANLAQIPGVRKASW